MKSTDASARAGLMPEDDVPVAGSDHASETVVAVMAAARRSGLLSDKGGRIAGRVSPELVRRAKLRTGIAADTDLIAYALAAIALEDNFADAFEGAFGTVDPNLDLGI